jgi:hypothetical protein
MELAHLERSLCISNLIARVFALYSKMSFASSYLCGECRTCMHPRNLQNVPFRH